MDGMLCSCDIKLQHSEEAVQVWHEKINLLHLKQSSGKLVIVAKGFLKLSNLITLIKQKSLSFPRNFEWYLRITDRVLSTGKSAIPSLFNGAEVSFFFSIWQTFLSDLILITRVSLPAFPSRTNVKMLNIPRTTKLIKKVKTNLGCLKGIWSWLYSSVSSEELWAWLFMHTSSTLCAWRNYVFQIVECCAEVYVKKLPPC